MPEFLLVPGRFDGFVLEHLEKIRRLGKPRAGRRRRPQPGIVGRKLPTGRATHGKSAHHEPTFIDRIMFLHVLERFEQIDFAGEFVGVAVAAVKMQHESIRRREFAR